VRGSAAEVRAKGACVAVEASKCSWHLLVLLDAHRPGNCPRHEVRRVQRLIHVNLCYRRPVKLAALAGT
jgi:hypothetical protein